MKLTNYITKSLGWITGAAIAAGIGYWIGRDHEHRDRLDDQDAERHANIEFAAPGPMGGGFRGGDGGPPTPPTPPAAGAATVQLTQAAPAAARMNQMDKSDQRRLVQELHRAAGRD